MFLKIADVLTEEQLIHARAALEAAWVDGRVSERALTDEIRGLVVNAIEATPKFVSAALPTRVLPPIFHRDAPGEQPLNEVNRGVRGIPGTSSRIRSDLAATLFLSDPSSYEGGDLVIRDAQSEQCVKLPAGHLILYSAGSRQEIRPVVRGVSFRCVFWIQSMIRDNGQRKILFDMDSAIQTLSAKMPGDPSIIKLSGVYHNLLRYWAQV